MRPQWVFAAVLAAAYREKGFEPLFITAHADEAVGSFFASRGLPFVKTPALQRVLSALLVLTPMMEAATATASGVLLLLAGAYQLTPLKARCLSTCRSPLSFIMQRWRPGLRGAFRMGAEHGLYCLGCCWALMLLLFAGGVMHLGVIAALTIFVLIEKMAPFGARSAPISGVALLALGVWVILS